jgi:hypothetical protein
MTTHVCPVCSYTTTRRYNLKRHTISLHGLDEPVEMMEGSKVQFRGTDVQPEDTNVQFEGTNVQPIKCPTCYLMFMCAKNLNRHLPKCKKISCPLECIGCHKVFNTRSALSMHRKRCDGTGENNTLVDAPKDNQPPQTVIHNNIHNTTHNVMNVAGNVNNTVININNFGNENKEYIAIEFIRQCLDLGHHGISPMIDKIYFDPEHPENHNVSLDSFKNRLVKVVQQNQWQFASLLNTVDTMISKASNLILTTLMTDILQSMSAESNAAIETIANVQSIQNLEPQVKRRLREHTKGRLARRRDDQQKES